MQSKMCIDYTMGNAHPARGFCQIRRLNAGLSNIAPGLSRGNRENMERFFTLTKFGTIPEIALELQGRLSFRRNVTETGKIGFDEGLQKGFIGVFSLFFLDINTSPLRKIKNASGKIPAKNIVVI